MLSLREEFRMSMLYITHDLGVIAEIADTVNVMYLGKVVESARTDELFAEPLHPYTRALLRSIPKVEKRTRSLLEAIEGTVPIPLNIPPMCGFYSRCAARMAGTCDVAVPALVDVAEGRAVRCFLHSDQAEDEHV